MHESARPGIHDAEAPDDALPQARTGADEPADPTTRVDDCDAAPAEQDESAGELPAPAVQDDEQGEPTGELPTEENDDQGEPTEELPESVMLADDEDEPTGEIPAPPGPTDDQEPTGELPAPAGRRHGTRWAAIAVVAAAALLVAGGAIAAIGRADTTAHPPTVAAPTGRWGGGTSPADAPRAVTAPLDGRTRAGLDLLDGATAIRLRTADLGADLYRVSTPPGAGVVPRITTDGGRVRLGLDRAPGAGPAEVDVALSARVRWDLRVSGGASLSTLDLREGRLGTVDLAGGASLVDLTLPRPDGTLTVRMTGGVSRFDVHTAARVPVRVRLVAGAGQVVLAGRAHDGVAAGALFTVDGWEEAVDRIDVDAAAGVSALTVAPY
ncbi:hypothetical protein [Krasilnikovia sp. MM14-A1259]|uniref:hypothetical protein n=1 Tax=Krasilnikovia sp. MM14-A1259 TaxID=3373539 RepID=UPI0038160A28